MSTANDQSILYFELKGPRGRAKLRVQIPWFEGKPTWRCYPESFLERGKGGAYWKSRELGLFGKVAPAAGGMAYARLHTPYQGLDEVAKGHSGVAEFGNQASGTWTVVEALSGPLKGDNTIPDEFQSFEE